MDLLVNAFGDILKHQLQRYVNTDDNLLNIKIISLLSIFISLLTACINKYFKINLQYCAWFIKYRIFKNKIFIFPLRQTENTYYAPADKHLEFMEIFGRNTDDIKKVNTVIKMHLLKYIYKNYVYDNMTTFTKNPSNYNNIEMNPDFIKDSFEIEKTLNTENNTYVYLKIAYVNGYFIYLKCYDENTYKFACYSRKELENFMKFMRDEIALQKPKSTLTNTCLKIVEVKGDVLVTVGHVKPAQTFDYYVSRYKKQILAKLDAFKDGTLFNNPYLDNNFGMLLHGGYGTGKSYLVGAIANYLKRDICSIDFRKVKTKSKFRELINDQNCLKYVYSFDEFDYLIVDIINMDANAEINAQLSALNAQLIAVKDNKDAASKIAEQIKTLMEQGTGELITLAFIQSELDSFKYISGRVIIATTNFITQIPAALKRAGRFDYVLELNWFNSAEIREILTNIYKPTEAEIIKLERTTFPENKYTPSEIILRSCEYPKLPDMVKYLLHGHERECKLE